MARTLISLTLSLAALAAIGTAFYLDDNNHSGWAWWGVCFALWLPGRILLKGRL